MATYKQPCMRCGDFIERDVLLCPKCLSRSPFGYRCPACRREIQKGQIACSGCGRELYTTCPVCRQRTFTDEKCEACGASLLVKCANPRCGGMQFFENTTCTECGKKLKKKK